MVLALGMFALGTDSLVVAGVLPEISQFIGVAISAAGQVTTIYAITYALLAPTIAALATGEPTQDAAVDGTRAVHRRQSCDGGLPNIRDRARHAHLRRNWCSNVRTDSHRGCG